MVNLPDSLYEDYTSLKSTWCVGSTSASAFVPSAVDPVIAPPTLNMVFQWINDIKSPSPYLSELALNNLAINRNNFDMLPLLLWNTIGTVAALLDEIVKSFNHIYSPLNLQWMPHREYNVMLLFQCIADHPETRARFIKAMMPHYFFPYMDIHYNDKPRECLRLGAMGVIAHLLKDPTDETAIDFILESGAFGHCTRAIEIGSTESKTLALFILHKILSNEKGLQYCCVLPDRFFIIDDLLKQILVYLSKMAKPSATLFNLVVACYAKISQKDRARLGIRQYLPVMLFDGTFANLFAEDPATENYRMQLVHNLERR